jgi:hypothetical protein
MDTGLSVWGFKIIIRRTKSCIILRGKMIMIFYCNSFFIHIYMYQFVEYIRVSIIIHSSYVLTKLSSAQLGFVSISQLILTIHMPKQTFP